MKRKKRILMSILLALAGSILVIAGIFDWNNRLLMLFPKIIIFIVFYMLINNQEEGE